MARTDYVADMEALLTRQLADAERQMQALTGQRATDKRRTGAAPRTPPPNLGDTERARQGELTRGAPPAPYAPPAPAPYAPPYVSSQAESQAQPYGPYGQPGSPLPPAPPSPSAGAVAPIPKQASLDELDTRIMRLQQLREWLKDDNLRGMIDDVINKHVRTAERRQAFFSAGIGVASLVVGWLLSALSPASTANVLFNLIHH